MARWTTNEVVDMVVVGVWRGIKRMEGSQTGFDLYILEGGFMRERGYFLVPKYFRPKRNLPRILGTDDVG